MLSFFYTCIENTIHIFFYFVSHSIQEILDNLKGYWCLISIVSKNTLVIVTPVNLGQQKSAEA